MTSRPRVLILSGLLAWFTVDALAEDGNRIAVVAVSIVQNGQVVLKKGYGFASLSP